MKGGGLYESLLFSGRDSQKFWTAFLSVARRDFNEYASRCFLASWKATTLNGLCWSQREYPPASSWWINPSPGHGLPCRAEDRRGMPRRGVRRSACFWPKEGEQDEIKLRVKLRREMSWKPCKTHGSNLRHLGKIDIFNLHRRVWYAKRKDWKNAKRLPSFETERWLIYAELDLCDRWHLASFHFSKLRFFLFGGKHPTYYKKKKKKNYWNFNYF